MHESPDKLRIDKWLWSARFFKTRRLAVDALEGGKVTQAGAKLKPARAVRVGDQLSIRNGQFQYDIEVLAIPQRRGPAPEAQQCYRETEESRTRRELLAAQLRAQLALRFKGRPTKRDRRMIGLLGPDGQVEAGWDEDDD